MSKRIMVAEGTSGQVELYEDRLVITRKGLINKFVHYGKGSKELFLDDVTGVQLKRPDALSNGYVQFGQGGYEESDGGTLDAVTDENSVVFKKNKVEEFEQLREKIAELKGTKNVETTGSQSSAIELVRRKYATGEITKEEYEERLAVLTAETE